MLEPKWDVVYDRDCGQVFDANGEKVDHARRAHFDSGLVEVICIEEGIRLTRTDHEGNLVVKTRYEKHPAPLTFFRFTKPYPWESNGPSPN